MKVKLLILVVGTEVEKPFREESHKENSMAGFFKYLEIGSDTED